MGFGGAFAGLADDATAAFANPAGLVQLVDPEVSVEGRSWRYSTPFTEGGRVFGEPTGIGLDTGAGLRIGESEEEVNGLSFLSFVYPKGRWSLAIYRHQPADFEFFGETQGLHRGVPDGPPGARERFPDQRSTTDFEITSHGLSVAYRVHDRLSLGLGIGHFEGQLSATSGHYRPPNISDPSSYLPETLETLTTMAIASTDRALNAGLLWEVSEQLQVGTFFREGPECEITIDVRAGPAFPLPAGTLLGSGFS